MSKKLQYELSARDKTKAALRSFKKGLTGAGKSLLSLKAGIIGLAASMGAMRMAQATRDAVTFGAQLQITSEKIGVTVESLQAFRIAAEAAAGVQETTMDMALQRFSRRLGEAQANSGELKGSLQKLGIDIRDAEGRFKSVEEVLFEYADGVAAATNASEQLLLAFKAFDSEGAVLVGMLKEGGKALREQYNRALESGAILTRGAATQSKVLNAELAIQGKIISTQLKGVLLEFGDILLHITTNIAKLSTAFKDFFKSDTQKFIDTIGEMTKPEILQNLDLYSKKLEEAKIAKDKFEKVGIFGRMASVFKEESFAEAAKTVSDLTLVMKTLKEAFKGGGVEGSAPTFLNGFSNGLKNVSRNLKSVQQLGMDFAKTIETSMVAAFDNIIAGTKTLTEGLKDLGRILIREALKMLIYRTIIAPFTSMLGGFMSDLGFPGKKQFGGKVSAGKPYIVGEAGRELFVPNQSGSIVPNNKLGTTVIQNISISTGVAATVRSEILTLLPAIAEVSKGAMIDSQMRGHN